MADVVLASYGDPARLVVAEDRVGQLGRPLLINWRARARWLASRSLIGRHGRRHGWTSCPESIGGALRAAAQLMGDPECRTVFGLISSWDDDACLVALSSDSTKPVIKMGLTEGAKVRVAQEADALEMLATHLGQQAPVPRLFARGEGYFVQERLDEVGRQPRGRLRALVLELLDAPSETTFPNARPTCAACAQLWRECERKALWHGDLTPWNVLRRADGSFVLIDWELATPIVRVPTRMNLAAWDLRVRAARTRGSVRVQESWELSALCFDRFRKDSARKDDRWSSRFVPTPSTGAIHDWL